MITIDGSVLEGGGQILRTSLGLSALTQQSFTIKNIRAKRENPGLREQHLQAIKSVKKLCDAEVSGDELYSKELKFIPGKITKKKLKIQVRTAGSTALILQTLFLASLNSDLNVRIIGGGTWNLYAPSILYLQEVFLPLLEKIGLKNNIEVLRNGFYPKGGAIVDSKIKKTKLEYLDLIERRELNSIGLFSIASSHLKKANVAERQSQSAVGLIGRKFSDIPIRRKVEYVDSVCPGSGILCKFDFEDSLVGYDVVGERGKQSEVIGRECAEGLLRYVDGKATVDGFMLDQLLPFLAFGKGGKFKFLEMTEHAKTNIEIIKKFLDVKFKVKDGLIEVET
ncbi:MAG: RNA 3'-terminal phosphate cyclase [Candidatus Woesearchaeota archaeon]